MDTAKAFDVVDHKGMLNSLYQQGVRGNMWSFFNNLYSDIASAVKWNGELSTEFCELQGIRQGGTSSADCYKAGKNKVLHQLEANPCMKIGTIPSGAIMVADDLALMSNSTHSMQQALIIAQQDASRERYTYNVEKTKVISINRKEKTNLILNNKSLGTSNSEMHLGSVRNSTGTNRDTIRDRIQKARRVAYSLMGAGFYGLNGVGPEIAAIQYETYVIPTLLYGLEALILDSNDIADLEKYHRACLRQIQHLPKSTASAAVYLLIGIPPIEALLDIKILSTYRDIADVNHASPPAVHIHEIITRQVALKETTSYSWVIQLKKTIRKYQNLMNVYQILEKPPKKKAWKKGLKKEVILLTMGGWILLALV